MLVTEPGIFTVALGIQNSGLLKRCNASPRISRFKDSLDFNSLNMKKSGQAMLASALFTAGTLLSCISLSTFPHSTCVKN